MPKRFFKVTDDVYISDRWELGHPLDQEGRKLDDPWQFRIGQRALPDERIRIPIKISGSPLDYSHAAFSIPIVHARVASLFTEVAPDDVQFVPVEIDAAHPAPEGNQPPLHPPRHFADRTSGASKTGEGR